MRLTFALMYEDYEKRESRDYIVSGVTEMAKRGKQDQGHGLEYQEEVKASKVEAKPLEHMQREQGEHSPTHWERNQFIHCQSTNQ